MRLMKKSLTQTLQTIFNPLQRQWDAGYNAGFKIGKVFGSEAERLALLHLINDYSEANPDNFTAEYPLITQIYASVKDAEYAVNKIL